MKYEAKHKDSETKISYVPEWFFQIVEFDFVPSFYRETGYWRIQWLGVRISRSVECVWS